MPPFGLEALRALDPLDGMGAPLPAQRRRCQDLDRLRLLSPDEVRRTLGDGNYGGAYQRSDEEMQAIWHVAVEETRSLIEGPWE